jgi:autotransporter-associated beta strand protein
VLGDVNVPSNPLTFTIAGKITGGGGIQVGRYPNQPGITRLTHTGNDFSGPLLLGISDDFDRFAYAGFTLETASLADGAGHGNIIFGRGNGSSASTAAFIWSNNATSALVLDHRRIELDSTVEQSVLANNHADAARTVTVNTDLLVSREENKTFILGGSNTGNNAFNGLIADSTTPAAVISLSKNGTGRWILGNANTYTGSTSINLGTLVITGATQATHAITVASNATLGLDIAAPVTAANAVVTLGGSVRVTGTPTLASHTLLTASSITGTPVLASPVPGYQLEVVGNQLRLVETPYRIWSGGEPFDGDANHDGVSNGLAWLLGANDPNVIATGLLPSVTQSGGGLVLGFNMLNAASRGSAVVHVQHSSDLGIADPWTTVVVPDASGGPTSGVTFTVTPGSPLNSVVAAIASSEGAAGKLFGRVTATE